MDSQAYYDRSRPSYPRTASRSSTSTTNTRATSQSGSSQDMHPAHRFHHASCNTPRTSTPRATPRLSREASNESNRQTAVSSFLQEKLQKERQVESERSRPDLSAERVSHGSPHKGGDRRPQSTTDGKKGMGVKDMEQVISSLHKQNFDLKLELYHRRERQTALEERVENLEAECARVGESNDTLLQEVEKRDKAVEEAVAMIVELEAKLEQFATERDMVQKIEAEGVYTGPTYDYEPKHEDDKVITRMPSFLSDRSETTENLRNVYLGVRGSVLSLPQVPESNSPGLASPSLSVLSESSFISVYGQKEVEEPLSLDGADMPAKASAIKRPKTSLARVPSTRPARSNSLTNTRDYQSISHIIQGSPLQQIERLDPEYKKPEPQRAVKSRRNEKRESLRRVLTDAPGGGARLHDMPPTPDTISTSTLRRFQNSNETLSKRFNEQRSYGDLSDVSDEAEGVSLVPTAKPLERARDLNNVVYSEARAQAIQRPRSADETTISNRRNDWDTDDDSDAQSFRSSVDIWMRQGNQEGDRMSPDLFSIPIGSKPWGNEMYNTGIDPERLLESFPQEPFSSSLPPPPPHRRSSLQAQTGSSPNRPATKRGVAKRTRVRRNSDDIQMRAGVDAPVEKHYPPIVGQTRNPLTKLFRRSIGSAPAEEEQKAGMGVPSWVRTDGDDRDSATPPPIMRNPRQSRQVSVDVSDVPATPTMPTHDEPDSPKVPSATGRRKWLPFSASFKKTG